MSEDEPNPTGDLVTCRACGNAVTFTKVARCYDCRQKLKPKPPPPSKAPEVKR